VREIKNKKMDIENFLGLFPRNEDLRKAFVREVNGKNRDGVFTFPSQTTETAETALKDLSGHFRRVMKLAPKDNFVFRSAQYQSFIVPMFTASLTLLPENEVTTAISGKHIYKQGKNGLLMNAMHFLSSVIPGDDGNFDVDDDFMPNRVAFLTQLGQYLINVSVVLKYLKYIPAQKIYEISTHGECAYAPYKIPDDNPAFAEHVCYAPFILEDLGLDDAKREIVRQSLLNGADTFATVIGPFGDDVNQAIITALTKVNKNSLTKGYYASLPDLWEEFHHQLKFNSGTRSTRDKPFCAWSRRAEQLLMNDGAENLFKAVFMFQVNCFAFHGMFQITKDSNDQLVMTNPSLPNNIKLMQMLVEEVREHIERSKNQQTESLEVFIRVLENVQMMEADRNENTDAGTPVGNHRSSETPARTPGTGRDTFMRMVKSADICRTRSSSLYGSLAHATGRTLSNSVQPRNPALTQPSTASKRKFVGFLTPTREKRSRRDNPVLSVYNSVMKIPRYLLEHYGSARKKLYFVLTQNFSQ
jgi:hypothetical protein